MRLVTVLSGLIGLSSILALFFVAHSYRQTLSHYAFVIRSSDSNLARTIRDAGQAQLTLRNVQRLQMSCYLRSTAMVRYEDAQAQSLVGQVVRLVKFNFKTRPSAIESMDKHIDACGDFPFLQELKQLRELAPQLGIGDAEMFEVLLKKPISELAVDEALQQKGFRVVSTFPALWRHYEEANSCTLSDNVDLDVETPC